jgi:hypothetical protein
MEEVSRLSKVLESIEDTSVSQYFPILVEVFLRNCYLWDGSKRP